MAFIVWLFNAGYAPATIATTISPLSFVHKMLGLPDPTDSFLVKKMLMGATKLRKQDDIRLPIMPHILEKLVSITDSVIVENYERTLLKAMFLLAFHAFLRLGEMAVQSKSP